MDRNNTGDKPIRDAKGLFLPGNPGSPGRPKGKTIKELVRDYLDEHPDDMKSFVDHFVKKNRDLAWQMLEGRPHQGVQQEFTGKVILEIDDGSNDSEDSPQIVETPQQSEGDTNR